MSKLSTDVPTLVVPADASSSKPAWRWNNAWTWVGLALTAAFAMIVGAASGFTGAIIGIGTVGFFSGIYVAATGRSSWLQLPSRRWGIVVVGAAFAFLMVGASLAPKAPATIAEQVSSPTPSPTPTSAVSQSTPAPPEVIGLGGVPVSSTPALVLLEFLEVKPLVPEDGYSRTTQFGEAWLDVDTNGCDTRNDILARDLTEIELSGPCKVLSGMLLDPYTDESMGFVRGNDTSALVQIDHVVSLLDAWQSGAQLLTLDQRIELANDPVNLIAVTGTANSSKGSADASGWLPPNVAFRCEYVTRQITVKAAYGLWVTAAEKAAMLRVLKSDCGDVPGIANPTPTPSPTPTPLLTAQPTPAPTGAAPVPFVTPPDSVYYANCTAVRAAGAAPLYRGQPGYSSKLDRDNDGVACE